MSKQKIEEMANIFGVDAQWAINTRLRYLRGEITWMTHRIGELDRMVLCELDWVHLQLLGGVIKDVEKKRYGLECQINYLKYDTQPTSGISGHHIEQAKNYPIGELLGIDSSTKRLRCPFHDDKHPSASIWKGKLHCFVCNKTWSSLDYLMEHDSLSFIDAVRRLSG